MFQALNENLEALVTNERPVKLAKEINTTLGRMLTTVKLEMMNRAFKGEKTALPWFNAQKELPNTSNSRGRKS